MRRELLIHFLFFLFFFVIICVLKNFFSITYWPFIAGGILGIFIPDIDHILYVLFLRPQEITSQRVNYLVNRSEIWRAIQLLYETRGERRVLIFHTIFFQLILLVLTLLVLSSSASLLARGLVLSFSIHLLVDQFVDLYQLKSFKNWTVNLPFELEFNKAKIYWGAIMVIILIMGILM